MEKLSSILPASPRVKSVDLSEAKPRRPGAPTFGIREGTTPGVRDRVSLSGQDAIKDTLTYKNPKEARSVKIADDVTRKFFETRLLKDEAPKTRSEDMAEDFAPLEPEQIEVRPRSSDYQITPIPVSELKETLE